MPWPSPSEYQLAVQDCSQCFHDRELQRCRALDDNIWGLPCTWSGNFAIVFCLQRTNRQKTLQYAVRCFTRPVTSHQERYRLLSKHLRNHRISGLVRFRYLGEGIYVDSDWYPIVKMVWVSGQTLDNAIEDALASGQVARLENWIEQWRELMKQLSQAEIGHGDLQHGNILITDQDKLVLVDYDGIFIPDLRGNPPNEVGHPNYQHPQRIRSGYYDQNVDSFSSLVIYLSLLALKHDPSLWQDFHDEDRLIFSKEDFENPKMTCIWQRLLRFPGELAELAEVLAGYCRVSPADLPAPDRILKFPAYSRTRSPGGVIVVSANWEDNCTAPHSTPSHSKGTQSTQTTGTQPWWADHLSQAPTLAPETQRTPSIVQPPHSPSHYPYSANSPQPSANRPAATSNPPTLRRSQPQTSNQSAAAKTTQAEPAPNSCVLVIIALVVALAYCVAKWLSG